MIVYNIYKLEKIINRFKAKAQKQVDFHVQLTESQTSLTAAIEVAARAVDEAGKTHFHQRRISKEALEQFSVSLVSAEESIKNCTSFDEIYAVVSTFKSEEINEITVFDTAFRIGKFLKIHPDKIYLSAGTRIGASFLLGDLEERTTILQEELPSPFQRKDITIQEIESILFEYRNELDGCVGG